MNQLDLWGGGQQLNRGSKYIENNKHNTKNTKIPKIVSYYVSFAMRYNSKAKIKPINYLKLVSKRIPCVI
jgi:hypothetical protein